MVRTRSALLILALVTLTGCAADLDGARSLLAAGRAQEAIEAALTVADAGFPTRRGDRAEAHRIVAAGHLTLGSVGMALAHLDLAIAGDESLREPICAEVEGLAEEAVAGPALHGLAVTLIRFLDRHRGATEQHSSYAEQYRPRAENLLLLGADTVRADHLGCYGYPVATSPNIDALAARSLRFERAFTVSPWTCPSFLSMFTGVPPVSHGVYGYPDPTHIPAGMATLWSHLHEAGFVTAAFTEGGYARPAYGMEVGFDVFPGDPYRADARSEQIGAPERLRANVDRTTEFLRRYGGTRFAVWFQTYQPHVPLDPPPEAVERLRPEWTEGTRGVIPPDRDLGREQATRWRQERGFKGKLPTKMLHDHILKYDASILGVDSAVGEILDTLSELGLGDRTLVVFLSDHGEGLMDHGLIDHGRNLYPELTRIPLLWRLPGQPPAVTDEPISTMGLANTVLWALGLGSDRLVGPFSRAYPPVTGHIEEDDPLEGALLMQGLATIGRELASSAALCWPHQLIVHDDGTTELYDLEEDPQARRDLSEARPDVRDRCHALWSRMWAASLELAARFGVDSEAPPADLDAAARERLRALGYIE